MDSARHPRASLSSLISVASGLILVAHLAQPSIAADLGRVFLYDESRQDLLNTWGGTWGGESTLLSAQATIPAGAPTAQGVCVPVKKASVGALKYLQCFASGFGPSSAYRQTRDLTPYAQLELRFRNRTSATWEGTVQLKDYRDSAEHCAAFQFPLSATSEVQSISVPLVMDRGWTLTGTPDPARVLTLDLLLKATAAVEDGNIQVVAVELIEKGGPVDIDTSPMPLLVERLARRQWTALWSARNRNHGLIPNNSYQCTDAGLNTTAATLWMLPAAIRRGWVTRDEADAYVKQLVQTTNRLLDQATYLPPRNVDWVTLKPSLLPEESSVDAAFLSLALYQYERLPSTAADLRHSIESAHARFKFEPFIAPSGWKMAHRYAQRDTPAGFVPLTYDGYTNEGNLVSLAAALTHGRSIPMEKLWNTTSFRVRDTIEQDHAGPMVHSLKEFRAPFLQALWNLFVDVRQRDVDVYADASLAVNPWQNFVGYQRTVMERLNKAGRPYLVQPDAGDDGSLNCYRQFSIYENFGQNDLFMPWSVSFSLLAGVDRSDEALRFLLRHGLHDPLGLADSARWKTGAAQPHWVASRHDFWNTSLSTMAMLEYLEGENRASKAFAELPDVRVALDRVFPSRK